MSLSEESTVPQLCYKEKEPLFPKALLLRFRSKYKKIYRCLGSILKAGREVFGTYFGDLPATVFGNRCIVANLGWQVKV